jgi:hypothetical protein
VEVHDVAPPPRGVHVDAPAGADRRGEAHAHAPHRPPADGAAKGRAQEVAEERDPPGAPGGIAVALAYVDFACLMAGSVP